ncbi:MAG: hypothetical protein KY469_06735 [Actinobacteria bacterium]|nr:hypothetical protein [Actinomycetota bacterium]
MPTPTIEELLETWSRRATLASLDDGGGFGAAVLDRLADGLPADVAYLADATAQPSTQVQQRIAAAAAAGYEVEDGAVVGAALTLNPTPHRFRVRDNDLYTWCGFDALFLPILLDEPAQVRSTCPVTSRAISLVVDADGTPHDVVPTTTVLAIVGAEVTSCCPTTGPLSAVCTQMPFLASRGAAEEWRRGRIGVAIVDLGAAVQVARRYAERR